MSSGQSVRLVKSDAIKSVLKGYERLLSRFRFLQGVCMLVTFGLSLLIVILMIEWLFRPDTAECVFLLFVFLAGTLCGAAWWIARPLLRRCSALKLATEIEGGSREFKDGLISAVQFSSEGHTYGPGVSRELCELTVSSVEQRLESYDVGVLVDFRRLKRYAGLAVLYTLLFGSILLAAPKFTSIALRKTFMLSADPWPTETILAFTDYSESAVFVPKGTDVRVRVKADPAGKAPKRVRAYMVFEEQKRLRRERSWMAALDALNFVAVIPALTNPVDVTVRGGDAELGPVKIIPVERPVMTGVKIDCTPPPHVSDKPFDVSSW